MRGYSKYTFFVLCHIHVMVYCKCSSMLINMHIHHNFSSFIVSYCWWIHHNLSLHSPSVRHLICNQFLSDNIHSILMCMF